MARASVAHAGRSDSSCPLLPSRDVSVRLRRGSFRTVRPSHRRRPLARVLPRRHPFKRGELLCCLGLFPYFWDGPSWLGADRIDVEHALPSFLAAILARDAVAPTRMLGLSLCRRPART